MCQLSGLARLHDAEQPAGNLACSSTGTCTVTRTQLMGVHSAHEHRSMLLPLPHHRRPALVTFHRRYGVGQCPSAAALGGTLFTSAASLGSHCGHELQIHVRDAEDLLMGLVHILSPLQLRPKLLLCICSVYLMGPLGGHHRA